MTSGMSDLPGLPARDFCLIRHGETTANHAGRIAGRLDVALTDAGRAQARSLAQVDWAGPVSVFTSPMSRAQDTARLGFPEHPARLCPGLRERDWGIFEGRPLRDLPARDTTPQDGEGWRAMILRVHAAITSCCAGTPDTCLPVLICHSGVIRATRLLAGQPTVGARAPNARPIHFRYVSGRHEETSDEF